MSSIEHLVNTMDMWPWGLASICARSRVRDKQFEGTADALGGFGHAWKEPRDWSLRPPCTLCQTEHWRIETWDTMKRWRSVVKVCDTKDWSLLRFGWSATRKHLLNVLLCRYYYYGHYGHARRSCLHFWKLVAMRMVTRGSIPFPDHRPQGARNDLAIESIEGISCVLNAWYSLKEGRRWSGPVMIPGQIFGVAAHGCSDDSLHRLGLNSGRCCHTFEPSTDQCCSPMLFDMCLV